VILNNIEVRYMLRGNILKMRTSLVDGEANYWLRIGNNEILISTLLNKEILLEYTGNIHCVKCGKKTNKSFSQGFCYPCFISAPETEECVLRPEMCRAHEGVARDLAYAEEHCLKDQYVYLALSSNIKVGVTRHTQIPTRWIDQGATFALPIAKTPNRYLAGIIEVALKPLFGDKTNWRKMLANEIDSTTNLYIERDRAINSLPEELRQYALLNEEIVEINYPNLYFPEKVKTINFDKINAFKGKLTAVKGQYLIFDNIVVNVRKYGGYEFIVSY